MITLKSQRLAKRKQRERHPSAVSYCSYVCANSVGSLCIKKWEQTKPFAASFYTPGQYFTTSDNKSARDLCATIFSGTYVLLTYQ